MEEGATRGTTALVINGYIAVYIQVLYKVTRVRRTGLAVSRSIGSAPHWKIGIWLQTVGKMTRNSVM